MVSFAIPNWIGDISGVLRNYGIEFSNDETNFQEFYFKAIKRACTRGQGRERSMGTLNGSK